MTNHEELRQKLRDWLLQNKMTEGDLMDLILDRYLTENLTVEVQCASDENAVEISAALKFKGKIISRSKDVFDRAC